MRRFLISLPEFIVPATIVGLLVYLVTMTVVAGPETDLPSDEAVLKTLFAWMATVLLILFVAKSAENEGIKAIRAKIQQGFPLFLGTTAIACMMLGIRPGGEEGSLIKNPGWFLAGVICFSGFTCLTFFMVFGDWIVRLQQKVLERTARKIMGKGKRLFFIFPTKRRGVCVVIDAPGKGKEAETRMAIVASRKKYEMVKVPQCLIYVLAKANAEAETKFREIDAKTEQLGSGLEMCCAAFGLLCAIPYIYVSHAITSILKIEDGNLLADGVPIARI